VRDPRSTVLTRLGALLTATTLLAAVATVAAPVALAVPASAVDDTVLGQRGGPAVTGSLLANDAGAGLAVAQVDPLGPTYGTLAVTLATGEYTYTPPAGWHGHVHLNYQITDGTDTSWGVVTVIANAAPIAANHTVTVPEDTDHDVSVYTLRHNATDEDGNPITVTGVSGATGGTVSFMMGVGATFIPAENLCGVGAGGFDYAIDDSFGGAGTGHVTIDITCFEEPPVAFDDTASMHESDPAELFDVLANDLDPDAGDVLTITDVSLAVPESGSVAIVGNKVQFTPAPIWHGSAVMTYTVSDGILADQGVLTVTVIRDNVAPVVKALTVTFDADLPVNETAPLRLTWSAADPWTGVAFSELQVKLGTGAWTPTYVGPNTTFTKIYGFNKTLQWRVRAVDKEGNVSGWVYTTARKIVDYQSFNSNLHYSGYWPYHRSYPSSADGWRESSTKGAWVSATTTARSIIWVAPHNAGSGWAKVYIDGKFVARVNLYSATSERGQISYAKTWTTLKTHTIKVVNDQGGKHTSIDAFLFLK
jgi:hypothetical protein